MVADLFSGQDTVPLLSTALHTAHYNLYYLPEPFEFATSAFHSTE